MLDKKIFSERLSKLRAEKKVSQEVIAQLLQVTRTQVSDLEHGKTGTTLERFMLLCEYYHVSADYLLGITDDPTWRGADDS